MVDPSKTAGNTLSERNLDVIVLQRYAGAFRAGVAAIFGAPDQKFEARTSPGSTQAEVVRTGYTPVELVLGYSIYFTGLCGPGRSYFTKQGVASLGRLPRVRCSQRHEQQHRLLEVLAPRD